jgi:hypothetical protein
VHLDTQEWIALGKRGIWLKLFKDRAPLISVAIELGFDFHHADPVSFSKQFEHLKIALVP